MKKRLPVLVSFTLLAILLPCTLWAGIIKGKVTDKKGEPLPFATVFVQGTTQGTSANAQGEYHLNLPAGSYKVACQYMGFKQDIFNVTLKANETIIRNFSLQEQSLQMKEHVVKATDEDPAYPIIRKTIARRKFHLQQVKSFQTHIYMKGVIRNRELPNSLFGIKISTDDKREVAQASGMDSNGKGVLYLVEEVADYYAKEPNKERTIIRSVKESGNPNGLGFDKMTPVVTFYENNIFPIEGITNRGLISPISDNALNYYKYKYEGEFREDGYVINKIKVTPKRAYEPLFTGTIYIVDDDWAIHSLSLYATQRSGIEMLDTLLLEQVHLPLKKDTWVIKNQLLYPTLKFFGFDIAGYFLTVYDNQKVNEPMPDTIFNDKIVSIYDKTANKKDTSYWTDTRPVPLQEDEQRNYQVKDSTYQRLTDPAYIDSMRRKGNRFRPPIMTGYTYNSKGYKHSISTNALIEGNSKNMLVNYNTVEGINVAPRLWWTYEPDTGKKIEGALAIRYGFTNTHFNAIGKLSYRNSSRTWAGRWWEIGAEGGKYVFQFNPVSGIPPLYNTISTLFYGQNYMKIYERWQAGIFFSRNYGNGFRWNIKGEYQQRLPLNNTETFTWSKDKGRQLTDNIPEEFTTSVWEKHNAVLLKISASYQPGVTYTQYPERKVPQGSDWPTFSVSYEKGIPDILNSKTDFDKWRAGIEDDIRLKLLGNLSYNIAAGGFLNTNYVSIPDLKHLAGNQLTLAMPYLQSFQLAPYYLYSNKAELYGELHVEYNMRGLLTNKIPLLRQLRWYLLMGNNTFYVNQSNYYTEAFIGIDNIGWKFWRFLRVDLVRSWDSANRMHTGFRIGIDPNGLAGAVNTGPVRNDNTEW